MIDQQAHAMAVTDVFYLSVLRFVLLVGVISWPRPQRGGAAAGSGGTH